MATDLTILGAPWLAVLTLPVHPGYPRLSRKRSVATLSLLRLYLALGGPGRRPDRGLWAGIPGCVVRVSDLADAVSLAHAAAPPWIHPSA